MGTLEGCIKDWWVPSGSCSGSGTAVASAGGILSVAPLSFLSRHKRGHMIDHVTIYSPTEPSVLPLLPLVLAKLKVIHIRYGNCCIRSGPVIASSRSLHAFYVSYIPWLQ